MEASDAEPDQEVDCCCVSRMLLNPWLLENCVCYQASNLLCGCKSLRQLLVFGDVQAQGHPQGRRAQRKNPCVQTCSKSVMPLSAASGVFVNHRQAGYYTLTQDNAVIPGLQVAWACWAGSSHSVAES